MFGDRIYRKVDTTIGEAFFTYGLFLARHPWKFLIASVAINCLLFLGMLNLRMETDVATIYTPLTSQSIKDSKTIQGMFPDVSGSSFQEYQKASFGLFAEVIVRAKTGNVLNITILNELKKLYAYVGSISLAYEGQTVHYEDFCARIDETCAVGGDIFLTPEFESLLSLGYVPYPVFFHPSKGPVYYKRFVGSPVTNKSVLASAAMMKLTFNFRTDEDRYGRIFNIWKDEFITQMNLFKSDVIDVAYAHVDSVSEEIKNNILGDLLIFVASFTLMTLYIWLALCRPGRGCLGHRLPLGTAGLLATIMAIGSAIGLVSACGVIFVTDVAAMPFLLIGIGVDDMFLILSGLNEAIERGNDSVEKRIADALRLSGVGITVTSLTDFLAFIAGVSSQFLAVKNFCIFTGVAVVICYLNQTTFFMACVILYERRLVDNKCHVTCQSLEGQEGHEGKESESHSCHAQSLFCPASLPKTREESESLLDKFPGWLVPKIVLKMPFKVLILIVFAGYLGASVYGLINMHEGLEFKQTVHEDSYFHKFAVWNEAFTQEFPIMFVVEQPYDYFNTTVRTWINEVLIQAVQTASMQNSSVLSWLSTYISSPFFNTSSSERFIPNLKDNFLTQPLYEIFQNDVVLDNKNSNITCSRFYLLSQSISSSVEQGNFMLRIRELTSHSSVSMIAFTPFFIIFEQYVSIVPQTVQTVSIAVVCVFIVTAILIPHPFILIYITGTVIMIMAGVFGFLYFVDLALNSITMTILIMAVGFSVDFTVHMSHGYLTAEGLTRHEKVLKAIKISGAPIFHGAMTSMIGIVMLLFLKSYTLRAFGKVIMIVMGLGILHALFFLPVVLSLIGPSTTYRSRDNVCHSDKARSEPKRWRCYFTNKENCSKSSLPSEASLQAIIEQKEELERY